LRKRQFLRRKLAKIAENCDHNIDPWYSSRSVAIYHFFFLVCQSEIKSDVKLSSKPTKTGKEAGLPDDFFSNQKSQFG
jgi:hypothetical protein